MKLSPRQREALELVADGKFYPCLVKEDDGWHARWRAIAVVGENDWVDEYIREFTTTRLTEDAEDQKHETLHDAWMLALRSRTGLVVWDDAECAAFAAELEDWSGNAAEDREARRGIVFTLSCDGACGPEQPDGVAFELSCPVPKGRRALRALGQAAYVWSPLCGLSAGADGAFLRLNLRRTEAEDLVRHAARELRDAGYTVEGVDLAASVTATAELADTARLSTSNLQPSTFRLTVRVAGEPVTEAEIRFLLDQGSTIVYFRERWIEVDRSILKEALRALEKSAAGKKVHALSFALGLGHVGRLELEEVKAHGWLRGLVNELRANACDRRGESQVLDAGCQIPGLVGTLRDYQRRGVAWLRFLTDHGFGALLADDMGLGKTVQVIAWILGARSEVGGQRSEVKVDKGIAGFLLRCSTFNLQPST